MTVVNRRPRPMAGLASCVTLVVGSLLAGTLGCGSQENLATVEGIVRIDGQPLSVGTVQFTPAAGRAAKGTIQSDGTFSLGTFASADGALVGVHGVSITAFAAPTGPPDYSVDRVDRPLSKSQVPARYASPITSNLTFEVKAGERNHDGVRLGE